MQKIEKIFCESIKKPVWIQEKQHKRGVRTPTTYRYGKHWEGSSGYSMEFLKLLYNRGLTEKDIDFNKGGMQHGIMIY